MTFNLFIQFYTLFCSEYPDYKKYDLENNSGYGTANHLEAIKLYGITPHHRKTFGPCKSYHNSIFM